MPGEGNRMTCRPFDSFLEEYRTVLPSSCTSEWNFRFQLAVWLDGIMYYSFLQYSEEGHRVLSRREVLDRVRRLNVDLVEVQRNAKPPVCKLADYHKEKYKQQIKEKDRAESKFEVTLQKGDCKEVRFLLKLTKKTSK